MKRFLTVCLALVLLLSMVACVTNGKDGLPSGGGASDDPTNTKASNTVDGTEQTDQLSAPKVVEIVDIAERDRILCEWTYQHFYSDDEYSYFYLAYKSKYVVVLYSDGTQKTVADALRIGDITIADLDKCEIRYLKRQRPEVLEIVDIAKRDQISCGEAIQHFYSDDEYAYSYLEYKSKYVVVMYADGTQRTVAEALKIGDITIADLDKYGIDYIKQKRTKALEIVDIAKRDQISCGEALQHFYSDDEYSYFYLEYKSKYVVVVYPDGTQKTVAAALRVGDITIADLDKYGIDYHKYKRPEVAEIIDIAKRDQISCGEAIQHFYSNDEYNCYYSCIKSQYVVVIYSNGNQRTAAEALAIGDITIADLDEYGIDYTKTPR